jgi:hypothetical protein
MAQIGLFTVRPLIALQVRIRLRSLTSALPDFNWRRVPDDESFAYYLGAKREGKHKRLDFRIES